jgi:hypothetical protein
MSSCVAPGRRGSPTPSTRSSPSPSPNPNPNPVTVTVTVTLTRPLTPFNKGLRANWTSVVRDATEGGRCGMRSPIDGGGEGEGCITIETKNATVPRMDEYTGAKIYSPSSSPVLDGHPAEAGDANSASGMTELHGLGDKAGPRVEAAPGLTPPPRTPGPPPTSAEFQVRA